LIERGNLGLLVVSLGCIGYCIGYPCYLLY
jgi:hypothetical protein